MSQISPYLRDVEGGGLTFWCPGCKAAHTVYIGEGPGPRWGYNGNPNKPTFTPSIKTWWDIPVHEGEELTADIEARRTKGTPIPMRQHMCHSFVTDGMIKFLDDCTHELRGDYPLPEWPTYR